MTGGASCTVEQETPDVRLRRDREEANVRRSKAQAFRVDVDPELRVIADAVGVRKLVRSHGRREAHVALKRVGHEVLEISDSGLEPEPPDHDLPFPM